MTNDEHPTYNGRYEVQRRIARGGMADVFLARDLLLARPVAVKVLFPEFAGDPSFVARFRREAQAAANLNHPNIVGVYDWGQESGTYYIVMEYVDGRSLSDILREQGTPPPRTAAGIAADVAAALSFAHRNGVIHRDIKPGNIMITTGGHVKVADFGIARAITAAADENLTQTGSVMGTATYFSPEQAQGHAVDQRSDLYSLGVVMYEMVHGKPPFAADSPLAVAYKHVQEPPVPLHELHPAVPAGYDTITMRLLAKGPGDRYPDAETLRTDLRRFLEGQSVLARPPAVPVPPGDATGTQAVFVPPPPTGGVPPVPLEPAYQTSRSRTGWFVLLLVVLLAALVGVLIVFASTLGVGKDEEVTVPNVVGRTEQEARLLLAAEGLEVNPNPQREAHETLEAGRVISQNPPADAKVDAGTVITLVVSNGPTPPETKRLPDVERMEENTARRILADEGFDRIRTREADHEDIREGLVISQSPAPHAEVPLDITVELVISRGPPPTTTTTTTEPPPTTTTEPPPTTTTEPPPTTTTEPPPTTTAPPASTEPPPSSSEEG